MAQEIIGKPTPKFQGTDNNQAVPRPSPADSDKNKALPRPDISKGLAEKAFGIRRPVGDSVGPSIFDK
jgi:hypothetical protein